MSRSRHTLLSFVDWLHTTEYQVVIHADERHRFNFQEPAFTSEAPIRVNGVLKRAAARL